MLTYKTYKLLLIASLFVWTGCMESRYDFNFKHTLTIKDSIAYFLAQLPGVKNLPYLGMKITANAEKITIYKASLKETYIQKDNLWELSELNDSSKIDRAGYLDVDGFGQDLYLLHYGFMYKDGAEEVDANAVVFLSFRYKPTEDSFRCTGHGPLYWGLLNSGYISFDSVLTIKQTGNQYYLAAKKSGRFNLLFMAAVPLEDAIENSNPFNIVKIVRMNPPNRIGGIKPLVFDIPIIFKDSNALHFNYIDTITLKH